MKPFEWHLEMEKNICWRLLGLSQWESPAVCLHPAVIDQLTRTAGFFPEEAANVFGLSVNRDDVKDQQFSCVLNVQVNGKSSSPDLLKKAPRFWLALKNNKLLHR